MTNFHNLSCAMRRHRAVGVSLLSVLFIIPLIIFSKAAFAAEVYTPKNIYGGWVRRVVEAPSSPGTMYATSYGVFKSTNGGETWVRLPPPPSNGVSISGGPVWGRHTVYSVAVSSSDADNVVVADGDWSAIWTSKDGGNSWSVNSFGGEEYSNYKRARMVASSQHNPHYFFTTIENMVFPDNPSPSTLYMSRNKGVSWSATSLGVSQNQTITDVLQMPSGRIVVTVIDAYISNPYSGTYPSSGKVYYSDDSGAAFSQAPSFTSPGLKMTWDATNNKIWLVTCDGAVYSTADGQTWTASAFALPTITGGPPLRPVGILYSNPGGSNPFLLAFSNAGAISSNVGQSIYRNINAAAGFPAGSWVPITFPSFNNLDKEIVRGTINDIVVDSRDSSGGHWGLASDSDAFYYTATADTNTATAGVVYKQAGINTAYTTYGIKDSASNRVFSLTNGVYYSPDNGTNWSQIYPKTGEGGYGVSYLALDPPDSPSPRVYLSADSKILYSDDNGADKFAHTLCTLTDFLPGVSNRQFSSLLVLPGGSIMYLGIKTLNIAPPGNYLYKSVDRGISWTPVSALTTHGIYRLELDPHDPDIIYAGAGDSGGDTSGNGDGLYRTVDGGLTWTRLGFENCAVSHIQVDPDNRNVIIAGYGKVGQYAHTAISSDWGATWRDIASKDPGNNYAHLLNTRATFIMDGILYAGNPEGFIYRGTNYGVTPMEQILVMPNAVSWLFKGSLYAATGSGLYALNLASIPIVKPYSGADIKVYNFPNPFNGRTGGGTVIRASFPSHVRTLKLNLYSLAGDLVTKASFDNVTGAYSYAFIWDGKNQEGKLCAPGLYFVVADADGTQVRHKIVMVR